MSILRWTGATRAPEVLDPDPGFDCTYGWDLDRLRTMSAPADEPAELEPYWEGIIAEVQGVDPSPRVSAFRPLHWVRTAAGPVPAPPGEFEVADLHY
ncbi:hypothetical protein ACT3TE_11095 [Brachybacterium sp. AOP42-B2-9]|uniref:hypothetical protein n=1 Tax=Brachybacterium sp. AOP42-B2-9 TaxID=3457672 RepID=UPI0040341E83